MNRIGLSGKEPALYRRQHDLAIGSCLAGVHRGIGTVERIEQFVAELAHEVLE